MSEFTPRSERKRVLGRRRWWLLAMVFALGLVGYLAGDAAMASEGGAAAGADTMTGELPAIRELFNTNFIVNSVLAALSLISVFLFLLLYLTTGGQFMAPRGFVDEVTRLVINGQYREAADYCRGHRRTFAASIVQRAVENAGKDQSLMMVMIDSEGRRRTELVWGRIGYLAEIANIAPMLGLLGTVWGMIKAFFAQEVEALGASSAQLTSAIGGAMSTTLFGLLVAIMTLVFHSIVRSRTTRSLAEVEQLVHSLADHIKRKGSGASEEGASGSTGSVREGSIARPPSPEPSAGRRDLEL
ncbi:MAG: MotA/TolQ/ExbB proton channel family protein [Phycisphaeraceae bacterium]|nr:MotA/TolQ/ExbB proton channel family protein [Phycisphaeraceae bacterium]